MTTSSLSLIRASKKKANRETDFFSFDDVCRIHRISFLAAHNFLREQNTFLALPKKV